MISNQEIVKLYEAKSEEKFRNAVNLFLWHDGAHIEKKRLERFPFKSEALYTTSMNMITGNLFTIYCFRSMFLPN